MAREELVGADCREQFSRDWGITFAFFRTYNEAMEAWLSCITLDRPKAPYEVGVVYSTPERAFADTTQPRVEGQVDIPKISFVMTGASLDMARFKPTVAQQDWTKIKVGDKWRLAPKPVPYLLEYNVSVWTQFQIDQDIIAYTLMSRFTPSSYLSVNGAASRITFSSFADTSELEPGADTDRIIRKDYSFSVEAWMPLPYREVGSIGSIIMSFNDNPEIEIDFDNLDPNADIQSPESFSGSGWSDAQSDALPNNVPGIYPREQDDDC